MLADQTTASGEPDAGAATPHHGHVSSRWLRIERILAFFAAGGLLLAYALRGGAYDIVAFEENGLVIWWILAVGVRAGSAPALAPIACLAALAGSVRRLRGLDRAQPTLDQ